MIEQEQNQAASSAMLAVYLINGDNDLKRETMLSRLSSRIASTGDIMLNSQTINCESIKDADSLLDAITTLPFGGLYRLVVLSNAEKLSKELSEVLIEYIKDPAETTVLALSANRIATNTRLYKAINSYNKSSIIDVSSAKRAELPNELRRLAGNYRLTLDYQAAQSLIDRVGTSMTALNNELRRLAAMAQVNGRTQLTVVDIIDSVPALIEPKPWELADALCLRDTRQVLRIVSQMHSTRPTTILLNCLGRLREILTIISLKQRGMTSNNQIASELKRQEWQIRASIQAANRFTEAELVEVLRDAHSTEAAMKSGQDDEHVLILWLVKICEGSRLPVNAQQPLTHTAAV